MPRAFAKPRKVPADRLDLVDILWRFYVAADRPTMRGIADAVQGLGDEVRAGTANHETVRRTLRGEAVGSWQTVEVIFLALCELADVDPDDEEGDTGDRWDPLISHRKRLRNAWNTARDGEPIPEMPRTRTERARQEAAARRPRPPDDPWGSALPVGSFNDEPPF
ncbi:hypothetical protein [Actinokineospora diospyrosa]|uniref:Uncharacterized protein n=1 Tax=Actinokineospora diospyrosa TaxID=103728 RepID=A0ABT1ICZ5_9PSEU|nr:hypothetical protein [Actinokineospora diospyrosa]MCP2270510.1 hypothetical protein [Actinokineospora diospyrosa]